MSIVNMEVKTTTRRSGIELLRIIAATMVVMSHIVPLLLNSGQIGGGNLFAINLLRSVSVSAVNIFILISGYFLWQNQKRSLGKALNLLVLMIVINVSSYIVQVIIGKTPFALHVFFRYFFVANYFVTLYLVLYFVSPYINLVLQQLTDRGWKIFITMLLSFFSIYAISVDLIGEIFSTDILGLSSIGREGSQHGYNIVNFILLYCLGAFLSAQKAQVLKYKNSTIIVVSIICTIAIFMWSEMGQLLSGYRNSAHSYHNPFVILLAISIFILFERMSFRNRLINNFAKAAFATFLMHQHFFHFLPISTIINLPTVLFIATIICLFLSIYLISWIVWKIYDFICGPVFRYLDKVQVPNVMN